MSCSDQSPAPARHADDGGCSGGESFALRVLGDDMEPEFKHGEIIIVEPDGAFKNGSYVLAKIGEDYSFRQLCAVGSSWALHALNPARSDLPDLPLPDLTSILGVVIQKAVPGRRKLSRFYT